MPGFGRGARGASYPRRQLRVEPSPRHASERDGARYDERSPVQNPSAVPALAQYVAVREYAQQGGVPQFAARTDAVPLGRGCTLQRGQSSGGAGGLGEAILVRGIHARVYAVHLAAASRLDYVEFGLRSQHAKEEVQEEQGLPVEEA